MRSPVLLEMTVLCKSQDWMNRHTHPMAGKSPLICITSVCLAAWSSVAQCLHRHMADSTWLTEKYTELCIVLTDTSMYYTSTHSIMIPAAQQSIVSPVPSVPCHRTSLELHTLHSDWSRPFKPRVILGAVVS